MPATTRRCSRQTRSSTARCAIWQHRSPRSRRTAHASPPRTRTILTMFVCCRLSPLTRCLSVFTCDVTCSHCRRLLSMRGARQLIRPTSLADPGQVSGCSEGGLADGTAGSPQLPRCPSRNRFLSRALSCGRSLVNSLRPRATRAPQSARTRTTGGASCRAQRGGSGVGAIASRRDAHPIVSFSMHFSEGLAF